MTNPFTFSWYALPHPQYGVDKTLNGYLVALVVGSVFDSYIPSYLQCCGMYHDLIDHDRGSQACQHSVQQNALSTTSSSTTSAWPTPLASSVLSMLSPDNKQDFNRFLRRRHLKAFFVTIFFSVIVGVEGTCHLLLAFLQGYAEVVQPLRLFTNIPRYFVSSNFLYLQLSQCLTCSSSLRPMFDTISSVNMSQLRGDTEKKLEKKMLNICVRAWNPRSREQNGRIN